MRFWQGTRSFQDFGKTRTKANKQLRSLALEQLDSRHMFATLFTPFLGTSGDLSNHSDFATTTETQANLHEDSLGGGIDPNMAIVNGTPTTAFPSVGIVGDASEGFCSGTLIAPQVVLTAGHCADGVAHTAGRFQVGGQTYATSQVIVHPQYNESAIGTDNAHDIALFRLNRAVTGISPSPIYRSTPQVGQLLTLVGFGAGGTGSSGHDGSFGTKRVGTTPIDQVSSRLILWRFDNNSESNTAPGDSGGPAFIQVGGTYYVAGVTSGGDQENAGIGDRSFDTRVDAYQSWLANYLGGGNGVVPNVSILATDSIAAETLTSQPANRGSVVIARDGATTLSLTVGLSTSGTATNGVDYAQLPTSVIIPAGQSSVTLQLSPVDDTRVEGPESAVLTLSGSTGYAIVAGQGTSTIQISDNDVATSNDMFANRFLIGGSSVRVSGTNVGATRESGEPSNAGIPGGRSIWWSWTAPASGRTVMTTAGSSFDTTLGVYTGNSVNWLQPVASNDDQDYWSGIYTSQVAFQATAGRTYQILVDGYYGESGRVQLGISQGFAMLDVPQTANTRQAHPPRQIDALFAEDEPTLTRILRGSRMTRYGRSS